MHPYHINITTTVAVSTAFCYRFQSTYVGGVYKLDADRDLWFVQNFQYLQKLLEGPKTCQGQVPVQPVHEHGRRQQPILSDLSSHEENRKI